MQRIKLLEKVRVLDLSRVLSGPFCTRMLSDLGAEVIKIESFNGDSSRQFPPFKGSYGSYFTQSNAGKKSLCVNFRHEKGIELVKKLVSMSDVLVENFRPGVLAKMGLGYSVLKEINDRIILCSISGFGQNGSESQRLAYTDIVQAFSGLDYAATKMISGQDEPPGFPVSLGDTYASMNAAIAILAALYNREHTEVGQIIDISMLDCLLSSNDSTLQKYIFSDGQIDTPGIAFRPPIKMKDGYMAVSIALTFERVVNAIGRPELLSDNRFNTLEARIKNFEQYYKIFKHWAREKTVEQAGKIFDKFDIPCARVNSTAEIIDSAVIRERDMLADVELHGVGKVSVINTPFKISEMSCCPQGPPPLLGEHNRTVFQELLGLSELEINELTEAGVIKQANE
jgi:CoA:oxalate CoA-transferase